jgi:hypothetical protein
MTKLYLKSGSYVEARAAKEGNSRYIAVYDDEENLYVVRKEVIMGSGVGFSTKPATLPFQLVREMAEIIENFEQYFNQLNQ